MDLQPARQRRSLKYIRLAAFLAGQAPTVPRIEMTIGEIEDLVDEKLPPGAKFPSWWRNDARKMHARAWLTAGWEVEGFEPPDEGVVFVRQTARDAEAVDPCAFTMEVWPLRQTYPGPTR